MTFYFILILPSSRFTCRFSIENLFQITWRFLISIQILLFVFQFYPFIIIPVTVGNINIHDKTEREIWEEINERFKANYMESEPDKGQFFQNLSK